MNSDDEHREGEPPDSWPPPGISWDGPSWEDLPEPPDDPWVAPPPRDRPDDPWAAPPGSSDDVWAGGPPDELPPDDGRDEPDAAPGTGNLFDHDAPRSLDGRHPTSPGGRDAGDPDAASHGLRQRDEDYQHLLLTAFASRGRRRLPTFAPWSLRRFARPALGLLAIVATAIVLVALSRDAPEPSEPPTRPGPTGEPKQRPHLVPNARDRKMPANPRDAARARRADRRSAAAHRRRRSERRRSPTPAPDPPAPAPPPAPPAPAPESAPAPAPAPTVPQSSDDPAATEFGIER